MYALEYLHVLRVENGEGCELRDKMRPKKVKGIHRKRKNNIFPSARKERPTFCGLG